MIIKIGKHKGVLAALKYNQSKVDCLSASILYLNKVGRSFLKREALYGFFHTYFKGYLHLNQYIRYPGRHISVNPHPLDKINDHTLVLISREYMQKMGYNNQPYIVYKHFDLKRIHLHIVSVGVDIKGNKIDQYLDYRLSNKISLQLCDKFGLTPYNKRFNHKNKPNIDIVDITRANLIEQLKAVVLNLPLYYKCQDFQSYNALLHLFNVKAVLYNKKHDLQGLYYFALDQNKVVKSKAIDCYRLSYNHNLESLQDYFKASREYCVSYKEDNKNIKKIILDYLKQSKDINHFKKLLNNQGINLVKTKEDKKDTFYFVSHNYKRVFCFPELSNELSHKINPTSLKSEIKKKDSINKLALKRSGKSQDQYNGFETHPYFDFLQEALPLVYQSEFVSFFNLFFNNPVEQQDIVISKKRKKKKLKL